MLFFSLEPYIWGGLLCFSYEHKLSQRTQSALDSIIKKTSLSSSKWKTAFDWQRRRSSDIIGGFFSLSRKALSRPSGHGADSSWSGHGRAKESWDRDPVQLGGTASGGADWKTPGRPWMEMRSNKAAHAAELSRPLLCYIVLQVIYVLKKGCDGRAWLQNKGC